jgi:hypothetical protein
MGRVRVLRELQFIQIRPPTPAPPDRSRRDIEATDAEIDKLVYELYGLTEEEIRIVEGKE